MPEKLFTDAELQQIKEAVINAEAMSGGEIVPVLVPQSDWYEQALWRAGALFALVVALILTILYMSTSLLLWLPPYLWLIICTCSGIGGAALAEALPSMKRFFISEQSRQEQAAAKARQLFTEHGISQTEQRSGMLLFVSFFEKQAVILPDTGISELVEEQQWREIVQGMTSSLRQGKKTEAICEAIRACGQLLADSGLQKTDSDHNELSDELRVED